MTLEQFKSKVAKENWYDKYYYYLLYLAAIGLGIFILYDVATHHAKYDRYGTRYFGYFAFALVTLSGIRGLFLVPNRYKILSVNSSYGIERKKEIIQELTKQFGDPSCKISDTFYSFTYKRNWWTTAYMVYLSINPDSFYVSVQSRTGGYYGGGIIDFGGTEKVRQKIIRCLTNTIGRQ